MCVGPLTWSLSTISRDTMWFDGQPELCHTSHLSNASHLIQFIQLVFWL